MHPPPLTLDREPDLLARLTAVRSDLPRVRCAFVHPCDPWFVEIKEDVQYGATRGRVQDARKMMDDLEKFAAWVEQTFR